MTGAQLPVTAHPLVSAEKLAGLLSSGSPPRVLDARFRLLGPPAAGDYAAGHVPGAVFVDVERDLSAPPRPDGRGGRHPLPAPEDVQRTFRRLGVDNDSLVVCYDDGDGLGSARTWWLLRYLGHRQVQVLDGGLAAWVAGGWPVEEGPGTAVPEGTFTARPGGLPVVDAEGAVALTADGVLLDVRAGQRYRGEVEPIDPVAGHIPGAVSAPTTENVDPDGRFLPPARLVERFAAAGVQPGRRVGAYCGSGITAAHTVLALELAGISAALYPGSWSDWVSDPDRPVATGPGSAQGTAGGSPRG